MAVQAMKAGAVEFLAKPFREQDRLDAIERAVEQDREARRARAELADLRQRFQSLTAREREVLERISAGAPNKQIAVELGISEATVKVHRGRVMAKMQAESLAQLIVLHARLINPLQTL